MRRRVPILLAGCLLMATIVPRPAVACGDMSVTLALIQQWPAARAPMVAEIRERRLGRLPAPSWGTDRNGSSVTVRQRRAMAALRAFQARLDAAPRPEATAHSFALLFVNDHIWSRYEVGAETTRLRLKGLRPIQPRPDEARIHVSAHVLDVLTRDALDLADAEASGILVVEGDPEAVAGTRRLLEAAFASQAG